jgi:predicted SAM-dependent methyltransferase
MIIKLNLGAGRGYMPGFVNIDKSKEAHPDLKLDLEKGKLPYKDNSVDEIVATHFLEHIQNIIPLMNECYRVLKEGKQMIIEVPQNDGCWCDPTHVRIFNKLSWRYYCNYPLSEIYGITAKFKLIKNEFIDNEDGGILSVVLEK